MKKLIVPILAFFLTNNLMSQQWVELFQNDTANFYTIQQSFNNYWNNKPIEKGKGYKPYKRWEWFTEPRVYPDGKKFEADRTLKEFQLFLSNNPQARSANGNWTNLGPVNVPSSGGGAGRINCVRFAPNNNNIIYAGAPVGGLWKSINGGNSWTLLATDSLQSIGISDIAIHPSNPNILYVSTGDPDGNDCRSTGILKSTDGGISFQQTGLNFNLTQARQISRVLIHPTNSNILLAATNNGVYRSTDAGVNWIKTLSGNFRDMEFNPANPNTVYVCANYFRYSTDGGLTWQAPTGTTFTGINRLSMAVTPANPNYIYLLASKSTDNGFHAIYRSVNSGQNFTVMSDANNAPNILGWSELGDDNGGQGWYDLAIAVSPTNADKIFTGGVNVYTSDDGGANLYLAAHWYGGGGAPYVHADIHDIQFAPGNNNVIYIGCDGGVFKTIDGGINWEDKSNGLSIGQLYRLGVSQTNANRIITGWQDNGTNLLNAPANWDRVYGGDGMECIISHANANVMYATLYYGYIIKSTDGGNNFFNIVGSSGSGVDEPGDWVTPYVMWAGNANHLYVGKKQVYKSTNGGTSFTQVGNIPGGSNLKSLAVAPSNADYIYAARSNQIFITTDGNNFVNRSAGLPVNQAAITYITVSNTNPAKAWVTFSGFVSGEKIYQTEDAGLTWTNISFNLPNLPANCVAFTNNSNDALYVGMDVGVYYKDASMSEWILFNNGLPNTIVSELEIQYSSSKIRAATYGRGLWESDLFTMPTSAPVASFTQNATTICAGSEINFTDLSANIPNQWNWNFGPNATPQTSTLQNPVVVFNNPGTYAVSLQVSNSFGSNSVTYNNLITVLPPISNNIISSTQQICPMQQADTISGTSPSGAYGSFIFEWQRSLINSNTGYNNIPSATQSYYVQPTSIQQDAWYKRITLSGNCSDTSNVVYIDYLAMYIPFITNNNNVLQIQNYGYNYQWYFNGIPIPNETDTFLLVVNPGAYSVTATDANGCSVTSQVYNFVGTDDFEMDKYIKLYPNPTNGFINLELLYNYNFEDVIQFNLYDISGKEVYRSVFNFNKLVNGVYSINLNYLSSGLYFVNLKTDKYNRVIKVVLQK
jgi:PKD repeat protein